MIRQHILHHTGAMHSICVAERCNEKPLIP
jgi:hypothetical protein